MRRVIFAVLAFLFPPAVLHAFPAGGRLPASVGKEIRALESHPALRGKRARVAALVYDITEKRILFGVRPDEPMAPASNMKIVTTAAALDLLGRDYAFTTRLFAPGRVRGGTLGGDLLLEAGGDPSWCAKVPGRGVDQVLSGMARALKSEGIRRVTGKLLVDASFFDREFVHPDWPPGQLQAFYEAPVGALTLAEACITVRIRGRAKPGIRPAVFLDPPGAGFRLSNRAVTVRRVRGAGLIVGRRGPWTLSVRGRAVRNRTVEFRVAVADPVAFAARVILSGLKRRGISVEGGWGLLGGGPSPRKDLPGPIWTLATPLPAVIRVVNKTSHNLMAEHVFKTLGRLRGGEGSFAGGRRAVLAWLLGMGLSTEGIEIRDGSGLSRRNRLTVRVLVSVLTRAWRSPWGKVFSRSLPVGGVDGTLAARMKAPPLKGAVLAKTGWIRGASALSGYLLAGKRVLAFSILVSYPPAVGGFNKYCKAAQERLLLDLASLSKE